MQRNTMNYSCLVPTAILAVITVGCAKPAPVFSRIHPGMTEQETIKALGLPSSISVKGNIKVLNYDSWDRDEYTASKINVRTFEVRLVDGKVESYGHKGDFK